MKKLIGIFAVLFIIVSCKQQTNDPGYGKIANPSAEMVESSDITGWTSDRAAPGTTCFYDYDAHDGRKSLTIFSQQPAKGRWSAKVLLKPWSTYRFTGWIKTENIKSSRGEGAGYRLDGLDIKPVGFSGNNEWTEVSYEFDTGNNDCTVISCLLGINGSSSGRVWFDDMKFTLLSTENISTAVSLDLDKQSEPMPIYIYGQFIEHLGHCIYGGIWAEMIMDRKFWYTPGERESPWIIEGNRGSLVMDSKNPFTGAHTPCLISDGDSAIKLSQSNLGLRADIEYHGRIILKASGGLDRVKITLQGTEGVLETIIEGIGTEFREFPLSFFSDEETLAATLTIEPQGKGRLWIGTVSLMPSDNIEGFRTDVLSLLKELDSPVYRWPGGNFVSGYNWKDGIGERDRRPPRKNPAWSGVESNDVGIHEFMKLCELLDTEPYIAVNAGLGNAEEARQEVEYTNGNADTKMGRLRTANGHPEKWKVKWWSIGNEMYGDWQLGHMSTDQFVVKHNEFANKMKSADPDIKLIAVGDVGKWDEMILAECADKMDLISEHFYVQDWHGGGLMTHINQVPDAIRRKAEAHRQYRKEIPSLEGKDIRICMDEWNYWYGPHIYGELGTRYFYRDAMGIAAGLNEFSKNTDIIYMANYAQTVNVIGAIKTNANRSVMASTGQVLKLYRHQFGTIPVLLTGDTRPLNIAATLSGGKDTLTISVINPAWDEVDFPVSISGASYGRQMERWSVTAPDDMSYNEPGRDPYVRLEKSNLVFNSSLSVPPASITIFRIPVKMNK